MGRSLQESTVVVAGTEMIGAQVLTLLPRFGLICCLIIEAGKTVMFYKIE
jgi:hypothetical protein